MSYLTFLLLFVVPPIVVLALATRWRVPGVERRRGLTAVLLTALIALLFTTPWDNYLVYRGVWEYGTDRVLAVIGYVPLEEYLFFILQPLLTGLLLYWVLGRSSYRSPVRNLPALGMGALIYLAASVGGILLLLIGSDEGLYLGLILAWASPVLLLMWLYGAAQFAALIRPLVVTLSIATLYLWIIDRIAIALSIWSIADRYSFDFYPLGLPVEEAVFFLVTNLLVVQGVVLFLYGDRVTVPWRFYSQTESAPPVAS